MRHWKLLFPAALQFDFAVKFTFFSILLSKLIFYSDLSSKKKNYSINAKEIFENLHRFWKVSEVKRGSKGGGDVVEMSRKEELCAQSHKTSF